MIMSSIAVATATACPSHSASFSMVGLKVVPSDLWVSKVGFNIGQKKAAFPTRIKATQETKSLLEDETIKRELQKEKEKIERQHEEAEAERQRILDKSRKEMREWWVEKWDAKKRSEGWGQYEKCWMLEPKNTSLALDLVVLSGEGVLVGAAPLVSGSIKPLTVDLPMVSGVHAHVYGKDVTKGYKKLVREYFVVDLGSTNGTYLNRLKLRPRAEVKLSPGDELRFGDVGAVFVVKKQA